LSLETAAAATTTTDGGAPLLVPAVAVRLDVLLVAVVEVVDVLAGTDDVASI
jgi:hypothetical protein